MIIDAIGSKPVLTDKQISIEPHYWVEPIADFLSKSLKGKLSWFETTIYR